MHFLGTDEWIEEKRPIQVRTPPRALPSPLWITVPNIPIPSLKRDERSDIDVEGTTPFVRVHIGSIRLSLIVAPANLWRPGSEMFTKERVEAFGC